MVALHASALRVTARRLQERLQERHYLSLVNYYKHAWSYFWKGKKKRN